jgi:TonB family protein
VAALLVIFGILHFRGSSSPAPEPDSTATTQTAPQSAPAAAPTPAPTQSAPAQQAPPVQKPTPAQPSTAAQNSAPAANSAPAPKKTSGAGGTVTHQVIPDIPKSAKNTITGTVKVAVRVEVDASGKVTDAKFKSAGPSKYFAGQALKAAQGWEFDPPQVDGQPVASAWLLQFRFKRTSTQASPSRITR